MVPSGVLGCFQSPRTPGVQSNPKMNGMVSMSFFFFLVLLVVLVKASIAIIISLFHTVCSMDMKAPRSSDVVVTVTVSITNSIQMFIIKFINLNELYIFLYY